MYVAFLIKNRYQNVKIMAAVLGERAIHGAIASKPGNRATQGQGRSHHQAGRAAAVGGVGLGTALEPGDSGEGGHTRRNPAIPAAQAEAA
jgi:hypothetical protein